MLSIFPCVSWPSECLLQRNVYLGLLLIFWLFFCCWATWAICKFWRLILCNFLMSNIYSPIMWIFISFYQWSLFLYFCFYFHYCRRCIKKGIAAVFVSVLPMFSSKNFIVSSVILRPLILLNLFLYVMLNNILIPFFTCNCIIFSATFIKETVFSPLNILISFVID